MIITNQGLTIDPSETAVRRDIMSNMKYEERPRFPRLNRGLSSQLRVPLSPIPIPLLLLFLFRIKEILERIVFSK
ncbi:hypothetical protein D1BOALGB6SA_9692 [Olavius sp. associated proteobacterium Delta 1]|nr:hypothetical protein D1BOALGB6SA_9692 [Olavius sp. associated proteobacterium Delta 1]